MTWAARTEQPGGLTSPEELAAAAHSACLGMALALRLTERQRRPQRLRVEATVTLDEVDEAPTIISSHLLVKAQIAGIDGEVFQAAVDEAAAFARSAGCSPGHGSASKPCSNRTEDSTVSATTQAIVLGVFTLASYIWIGGYIAIAVVARTLATGRVLRALGRAYLLLGGPALLVALSTGAGLLSDHFWDGILTAAVAAAAALLAALAVGVVQARSPVCGPRPCPRRGIRSGNSECNKGREPRRCCARRSGC